MFGYCFKCVTCTTTILQTFTTPIAPPCVQYPRILPSCFRTFHQFTQIPYNIINKMNKLALYLQNI